MFKHLRENGVWLLKSSSMSVLRADCFLPSKSQNFYLIWYDFHRGDEELSSQEDDSWQARSPCGYRSLKMLLSLLVVINVFSSSFSLKNGSAGFGLGLGFFGGEGMVVLKAESDMRTVCLYS